MYVLSLSALLFSYLFIYSLVLEDFTQANEVSNFLQRNAALFNYLMDNGFKGFTL